MPDEEQQGSPVYRRMAILRSCFSPGKPIMRSTLFGGRAAQMARGIDTVYDAGTHGIIFGERGVGKTSFANCLADFIPGEGDDRVQDVRYWTPRVNCNAASTFSSIWRDVFFKIDISWREDTETRIVNLASLLPSGDFSPNDVLRPLEIASSQKDLIIVIDEFDTVLDRQTKTLMAHTIKALSDHTVGVTVFLVGVADNVDQLVEEHQSIGRCLVQILMPRMDDSEVEKVLHLALDRFNRECQDFQLTMSDETRRSIAALSRGMPFYIHLLGREAGVAAIEAESEEIAILHLRQGMISALSDVKQQHLSAYQRATNSAHKNIYAEVLAAAALAATDAEGCFVPASVRAPLSEILKRRVDIPVFMRHLNELAEKRGQILERRGEPRNYRFRFRDALIPPYIILRTLSDKKIDLSFVLEKPSDNN